MYYRVAIQVDPSAHWQWKSTVFSSLNIVFHFLRLYRAFPSDRLRVFSCSSYEEMNEQLMRENKGLRSTSVTAAQFLEGKGICSPKACQGTSERQTSEDEAMESSTVTTFPSLNEMSWGAHTLSGQGMNALERRRFELEYGAGGDHDAPYTFSLPASWPLVLAWMKLLAKVQNGELYP
jgi:hypothetical protein